MFLLFFIVLNAVASAAPPKAPIAVYIMIFPKDKGVVFAGVLTVTILASSFSSFFVFVALAIPVIADKAKTVGINFFPILFTNIKSLESFSFKKKHVKIFFVAVW